MNVETARRGWLAFVVLLACVVGANWAIANLEPVTVWPGIVAPAGVLFAGAAFVARDWLREAGGRWPVVVAILSGAALSWGLEDVSRIAAASAVAFAVSELADSLVYEGLRSRSRLLAVGASSAVGLVVDSVLFLAIAFGDLDYLAGQLIGKTWVTLAAVVVVAVAQAVRRWTTEG